MINLNGMTFLNNVLGEEGVEDLRKFEAALFKPKSNVTVSIEEMALGLQIVPRSVMAFLKNILIPMKVGDSKKVEIPISKNSWMNIEKKDIDVYSGDIFRNGEEAARFKFRSLPGVGLTFLTVFEMYEASGLDHNPKVKLDEKTDKAIQEDIELKVKDKIESRHQIDPKNKEALADFVNSSLISYKDAIGALINEKLSEALRGIDLKETKETEIPKIKEAKSMKKNLNSDLEAFLGNKKQKKNSFKIELKKSDKCACDTCGKEIFGNDIFSGCVCMGTDAQNRVHVLRKSDNSVIVKFHKSWDEENTEVLVSILRSKRGEKL